MGTNGEGDGELEDKSGDGDTVKPRNKTSVGLVMERQNEYF